MKGTDYMTLADRLNHIIKEQGLTKAEFARKVGISENYIYLLTGHSKEKPNTISASLAMLIALEFGYDADWVMNGEQTE